MKKTFKYLLLCSALMVSFCSAYFSIFGLGQLFSGSKSSVILMASILEIAKIVTTTALHKYWSKLAFSLKSYLTICVFILMSITSIGIYGFLIDSYQKTSNKLGVHDSQMTMLESKIIFFEKTTTNNEKLIYANNKRIDGLSNLRTRQETRLDSAKTNKNKNNAREDIQIATDEIKKLMNDNASLNLKNSLLSDSISTYKLKEFQLTSQSDVVSEIGPLKYISELTGVPMNKVVNVLVILFIIVFDPLAIVLILMSNKVFKIESEKTEKQINLAGEEIIPGINKSDEIILNNSEINYTGAEKQQALKNYINHEVHSKIKNDKEVVSYLADTNGEFVPEKKEEIKKIPKEEKIEMTEEQKNILDEIKKEGIENNSSYLGFLDVLFKSGKNGVGDTLSSWKVFLNEIKLADIKYTEKEVTDFLTICNYFKIIDMSDKSKPLIMKDYSSSKRIISPLLI